MADDSDYSGLTIPTYEQAPDFPGAMSTFRESLAPHIVLFATSTADRDARYGAAPAGTLVSIPTTGQVFQRQSSGWVSLFPVMAAGQTSFPAAGSSTQTNTVTLPAGVFTVAPTVMLTVASGGPPSGLAWTVGPITTSSFTVSLSMVTGHTATAYWFAVGL